MASNPFNAAWPSSFASVGKRLLFAYASGGVFSSLTPGFSPWNVVWHGVSGQPLPAAVVAKAVPLSAARDSLPWVFSVREVIPRAKAMVLRKGPPDRNHRPPRVADLSSRGNALHPANRASADPLWGLCRLFRSQRPPNLQQRLRVPLRFSPVLTSFCLPSRASKPGFVDGKCALFIRLLFWREEGIKNSLLII